MKNVVDYGKSVFFSSAYNMIYIRGIIAILLGVCFIISPAKTMITLTYIFGIMMIVFSIFTLLTVKSINAPLLRKAMTATGFVILGVGFFMMFCPQWADFLVLMVVAFLSLTGGYQQLVMNKKAKGSGYVTLSGVLSILLGVLIILSPAGALATIGIFLGIYLMAFGVFIITLAWSAKRKNH